MTEQRRWHGDEAFTLVEVMVVALVIGVLIAIALPMFLGAKARAEEKRTEAQLRTGQTAGLTYWADGATFTAFDAGCTAVADSCGAADDVESSVVWIGPGQTTPQQVSIVVAAGNSLLLVSQTAGGDFLCIAQSTGQAERGRGAAFGDVDSLVECTGGW
jgi:prepilin-type N-terminal cleavage/methylation domain-containing protein